MKKRRCAVCSDTNQTNVKLKWRNDADELMYHVCMYCAENNKVNSTTIQKLRDDNYTTYVMKTPSYLNVSNKSKRPPINAQARGRR